MTATNEIQTLHDGRWRVSAVFESVEVAIGQATRLAQRPDSPPLRVVQEKAGGLGKSLLSVMYDSSADRSGDTAMEEALAAAGLEPVAESGPEDVRPNRGGTLRDVATYAAVIAGLALVGYAAFLTTLILAG